MDGQEADQITILTLRQIGCDLPDVCSNFGSFGTSELFKTVSHVLSLIGEADMPSYDRATLPREMSSKFKACTVLAEAVVRRGYREECGFHQFLYPSPNVTRELVAFVLSKLPQAETAGGAEPVSGAGSAVQRSVVASLRLASKRTHRPPPCRNRSLVAVETARMGGEEGGMPRCRGPHGLAPSLFESAAVSAESRRDHEEEAGRGEEASVRREAFSGAVRGAFQREGVRAGAGGGKKETLVQVMAEWTGKGGGGKSRFGRAAEFGTDRGDADGLASELTREERMRVAEEEMRTRQAAEQAEREAALAAINEQVEGYASSAEEMSRRVEVQAVEQRQVYAQLDAEVNRSDACIADYQRKKQALSLLKDRDANMASLHEQSAAAARGLVELAAEWEKHRGPLVEALRGEKSRLLRRKGDMVRKAEAVKAMRGEMREVAQEIANKEELRKSLEGEYVELGGGVQRASYTRRIIEIVKNVDKQDRDIQAILADTRGIQKDMNSSVENLHRSYGATDDMVYRDAHKGDAAAKKMYRELVKMHECFESLTKVIAETGDIANMIRDIEIKMEQESTRAGALNLDAARRDLAAIAAENEALKTRLA